MRQDTFTLFGTLLREIWRFFNSWYVPGTNVTPAGFLLIVPFLVVNLRVIRRLTFTYHPKNNDSKGGD